MILYNGRSEAGAVLAAVAMLGLDGRGDLLPADEPPPIWTRLERLAEALHDAADLLEGAAARLIPPAP